MLLRRGSHVALASFELTVQLSLALNSWSSYLHQLSTKIQGMHHHSQLTWYPFEIIDFLLYEYNVYALHAWRSP